MRIETVQRPLRGLVRSFTTGTILLPQFQRDYVWKPKKIRNLLDSLLQEYATLCRGLSFEFRAHDLGRTAATRMAEAGVPCDHIANVLNHVEGGPAATRVYDRYAYDAEKREALERWARRLTPHSSRAS